MTYPIFNLKNTNHDKKKNSLKRQSSKEPDLDVTHMLDLIVRVFRITITNVIRALIKRIENMQEQMSSVRGYGKNEQEMLEIKTTARDMKNAFSGLISRFNTAENQLEVKSIETFQVKIQRKNNGGKKTEFPPRTGGDFKRYNMCITGISKGKEREQGRILF